MYFEKGDLTKNPAFTPAMPQEHLNRPSYELGVKQMSDAKAEQNLIKSPLKSQEPKLLTYKPTSEIYKEAKAKGLSYAEFKALREQEKATRALHTTRYIEFKKAESQNIKDLLDPNKPLKMLKPDQITERLLDQVKKHNAKVWVGELNNSSIIEHLGLRPDRPIKFIANGEALIHVQRRHGINSIHHKRGQPPIETADIANYPSMVNDADIIHIKKHNAIKTLVSGKQINGYFVVVEVVGAKNGQLNLKTMYKENGKLENSPIFKDSAYIRLSTDSASP
ncbi:hypothetical protein [Helicobacter suis]|uniref:PBECR3 domain-containing polyvalent protein n=2 Tax=Helicobacter suis TaxID=104628 RepID=UPI0013D2D5D4|nr:hypothetical protein [Helicobacter suis]